MGPSPVRAASERPLPVGSGWDICQRRGLWAQKASNGPRTRQSRAREWWVQVADTVVCRSLSV